MKFPPIAKPRPKLLDKREASAKKLAEDIAQNKLVKIRSQGQCEVRYQHREVIDGKVRAERRCGRRASHIHHLRSGIGIRNRGTSIKSVSKLHVCENCHTEIHGHVLRPVNELERYEAATVRYERVK
jgi:hypothetical protein